MNVPWELLGDISMWILRIVGAIGVWFAVVGAVGQINEWRGGRNERLHDLRRT